MAAPAWSGGGGWAREDEDEQPASGPVSRYRYVPREREEYAARRALFLQSYRLSTRREEEEEASMGLRGRVARRLRDAGVAGRAALARTACQARGAARWWLGAGLGKAWRVWRRPPRLSAHGSSLLGLGFGCFGGNGRQPGSREYHFLEGFA